MARPWNTERTRANWDHHSIATTTDTAGYHRPKTSSRTGKAAFNAGVALDVYHQTLRTGTLVWHNDSGFMATMTLRSLLGSIMALLVTAARLDFDRGDHHGALLGDGSVLPCS